MRYIAALILATLACLAAFVSSAHAQTVIPLTQSFTSNMRPSCSGASFNVDNSVLGACRTVAFGPSCGRGCQPVQYTTTYIAHWDAAGNSSGVEACSLTRHHLPQADVTTYLGGHTAEDCPPVILSTHTVIVIDDVPYYYITTDAITGAELVVGALVLPTTASPDYGQFY